ncbi:alpha-amylase family glycosyl hydrolase [Corallococcus silvisoli]|uniref:alpha-amylase family glycosyl hydrolase n=1 Tax=Corallococcus silvisoli TaxID=2697031 RepID=UPI0013767BC0|nr:alpha-amylase family glycosyl hydrolase [Corallococcus silvisoli]NBD08948.1 hypothetical protein [Corallococcus silvisoli]
MKPTKPAQDLALSSTSADDTASAGQAPEHALNVLSAADQPQPEAGVGAPHEALARDEVAHALFDTEDASLHLPGSGLPVGSVEASWLLDAGSAGRDWKRELRALYAALDSAKNDGSDLTALTTQADVLHLLASARVINAFRAEELVVRFYEQVRVARAAQSERVRGYFASLPANWFTDSSIYYTYPHSLGVPEGQARGTLFDLAHQLPSLLELGYRNIQMLPHWSHGGGDGGYDVSDFTVDPALGGEEGFRALMDEAMRLGMRVITDFIPDHISVRHPWFQALLAGDERKLSWFLPMDAVECVGNETDRKGKLRVLLQSASGTVSRPWAIFPHASKRNLIDVEVNGKKHHVFHSFYPFQVDLNLRNPEVLGELFAILGWELSFGVVGKRMDAAPHWFKKEGTDFENLAGTHALQELFKSFVRHVVVGKGIIVPEVGEGLQEATGYFGRKATLLGEPCHTEGDAMYGFEWNSTLWALLLDGDAGLFWRFSEHMDAHGADTFWFNMGRHHDELRTDLMPVGVRERVEAVLLSRGAQVFAGRGVGGRMADFLQRDPRQIAKAFFLNALPPRGVPVTYYGDEVGAVNQPRYMAEEHARRLPILTALGFPTGDGSAALDRRDIGRGSVYAGQLAAAREAGYLPLRTTRALNRMWETRASLRRGDVARVGHTGAAVLSTLKVDREGQDTPLWALCNLTGAEQTVTLSGAELRGALGAGRLGRPFGLRDVLAVERDGAEPALVVVDGDTLTLTLAAHAHLLLEAVPLSQARPAEGQVENPVASSWSSSDDRQSPEGLRGGHRASTHSRSGP